MNNSIAALAKIDNCRALWILIREWLVTFCLFAAVIHFKNIFVWAFCFILLARQSYAFFVLFHDAAHSHLFSSRKWNDIAGNWLCGGPITFALDNFRSYHLKHHAEPLVPTDPDIKMISGYPIKKFSFFRKVVRDLLGVTNFKGHLLIDYQMAKASSFDRYVPMIVSSSLIWLLFYLAGHGSYFFLFWMLPGATVSVLFVRIGLLAQHAGLKPNDNQGLVARTVVSPMAYFFAPLNHNYHVDHHLYPAVPFYNLHRLHDLLLLDNEVPATNIFASYNCVLKDLVI